MHDAAALAPQVTARFSSKREAIGAAATELLNAPGVRGMTLAEVAERVRLITSRALAAMTAPRARRALAYRGAFL